MLIFDFLYDLVFIALYTCLLDLCASNCQTTSQARVTLVILLIPIFFKEHLYDIENKSNIIYIILLIFVFFVWYGFSLYYIVS